MKILHLASHTGNIGDNISHIGLHNILNQILGNDYTMDNLEIRKSYNIYKNEFKRLGFDTV